MKRQWRPGKSEKGTGEGGFVTGPALGRHGAEAITSARGGSRSGYLANLEMVEWRTWKVLAIDRQLSPAARRLSASAC